jgi:hypothetical protein
MVGVGRGETEDGERRNYKNKYEKDFARFKGDHAS